jgi:tryptophanyl-tRNA synthetase
MDSDKQIILTGDRPTGRLHLGHYVGSLANRTALQDAYSTFIVIADFQVLIDHLDDAGLVEDHIYQMVIDYLSVGLDPDKSTIFIQSAVPQLTDLTMYLSMLVTVARLRRNPTLKAEAGQVGVDSERDDITYGFLGYPVSQAADILLFRAHLVPAGEDQRPHIEQTRELARKFNRTFGEVFPLPDLLVSDTPRLPGLDGNAKMSKSLGNAVNLADPRDVVEKKVMSAVTDPSRAKKTDPGHPEVCSVFAYHEAFDPESSCEVASECRAGNIGCVDCKRNLICKLEGFLEPVREKRAEVEKEGPDFIRCILNAGCLEARAIGDETMDMVRQAVGYDYGKILSLGWFGRQ